jgi:purine-binding chemotaxis protein CheW
MEGTDSEKYLVFSVLDKLYSLPSRQIGEIAVLDTVYPLPLMPPYVPGVINRYSVPYVLFDIGILFHQKPCANKKVLVLKEDFERIAFMIDDVKSIEDTAQGTVLDVEAILSRAGEDTALYD